MSDRYGITQLVFDQERTPEAVYKKSLVLGREDVIQIKGKGN
jgi:aspartyl-tRNA synthetase